MKTTSTGTLMLCSYYFILPYNLSSWHQTCRSLHFSRKTMYNLGIKLEEYWQEIQHKRKNEDPNSIPVEDITLVHSAVWLACHLLLLLHLLVHGLFFLVNHAVKVLLKLSLHDFRKRPDQNWAQCDECMKWRKLPDGIDCNKLPEKWYCRLNPDPQFR